MYVWDENLPLLVATKPTEKRARKSSDSGFKTAPDGRLIITESSDEGDAAGSDDEDIDDLLDALEKGRDTGKVSISRKKKQPWDTWNNLNSMIF